MRFARPEALWLVALAVPIVLLHVLRPRRDRHPVSSVFLWEEEASPVSAATPWQRLRPSWLLLLQLLALLGLTVAAADPVRLTDSPLAEHTVFIVDASGSMAARDGSPDRSASAVERAGQLRAELPSGGVASLVVAGARPRVLLSASDDEAAFADALARIEVVEGASADFATAFTLAASLESPGTPIGFVLLSDGGVDEAAQRVIPPGTTYEAVGERSTNRAITGLVVEPRGSGLHAIVTVANLGAERATQTLRVDLDGVTQADTTISLGPGERTVWEVDLPDGDRVDAFLEGEDLLDADDHAYAVTARRRELEVLVVGGQDPYLERALAVIPGVTVTHDDDGVLPVPEGGTPVSYDLVVYDRVAVPIDPPAPYLAVAPPGGAGPVAVTGSVEEPVVTLVDTASPLLEDLDLSDVGVATAQQVDPGTATTLVAAPGAPLLVQGSDDGVPFVYLSFVPADSSLPLSIAFPILVDRVVGELAGAALPPAGLVVGDPLPTAATELTTIVDPAGNELAVPPGSVSPRTDRSGFWTVRRADGTELAVAVNADPAESELSPVLGLPTEARQARPGEPTPQAEDEWLTWVVVPLLVILLLEWLVARRRVGVPRRQWRGAVALRVAVAGLLVAALLGPTIERHAGRVATVFVVDASDSVSTGGEAQALDFVRAALDDQPAGALSAVALFGTEARLELTMQEANRLGIPAVQIDPTRTDIESALRLAAAVLPEDARRRIVLLSDGRSTEGDPALEAQLLAEDGIQLDVVTVGRSAGLDVAIAGIDAPSLVREGEEVTVEARVDATEPATVLVTLLEDGIEVDEQAVEVAPGPNTVRFQRPAGTSGLVRYQVRVSAAGDAIVQNDIAYAAVQVEGPARVLVVEGSPGNAETLAAALVAGGIDVETVRTSAIPPLDELTTYSSVVLVDVDVRSLSTDQLQLLSTATRELGRGLVTIGGDRSYGLGGYLDSPLEELLPVVSEILDPRRRQTVAEVLAIDTSGSMGACHCAEGAVPGFSGNRVDGGVNKTDISRSGAARAIEALSENDEVGVLAFNSGLDWVIPLQQLPSEEVVTSGLRRLAPSGGTDVTSSLATAAEALRESQASLKHVILFTDGFTELEALAGLAEEAGALAAEGITVSVVATGEGAADELEDIAEAGNGRFYPGRDLQEIPEILMEEAVIASRDFVTEGTFFPQVTSSSEVVAELTSSPALLGYIATTAKPTASTLLRIGPDGDPLLARWQVGLGRATSWTSDAAARWSSGWAGWDGYVDFWAGVVKDTFPAGADGGTVRARIEDGTLFVTLEGADAFPDGASATARVAGPDGVPLEVPLTRTGAGEYQGELAVEGTGSFAVGAAVTGAGGEAVLSAATIATTSYAEEYQPGTPDEAGMLRLSAITGGRGAIDAAQAFDAAELPAGRRSVSLAPWLLLAAALLWPLAVTVGRLVLRGTAVAAPVGRLGGRLRAALPARPGRERSAPAAPPRRLEPPPSPEPAPPSERTTPATVGRLLERKRQSKGD